ncbi:acyl-CoA dehydrogenase family protein [Hyphomicrobium sp. D-2]|uniref:acyl-CoA dehydrogenase family protein n=1 Tax=Hyphomicrobium sp. D-2 TaxID=3041621 RepID=UPI0024559F52|nr:acyl-CoA dehydrogenase family protein [Hyphomicrobium sp. D-2]MDH4980986.1 acyl-CoA dehydrogenase family protein [Hyphomicrobium sp. D-2]
MTSPSEQAWGTPPSARYDSVAENFRHLFRDIAQDAALRDTERRLPFEEISALREAGFAGLRVPQSHGGSGVSLPEYFSLLVELAEAELNLVQIIRGHAGFVENVLNSRDEAFRERWLNRIGREGAFVGPAWTEPGDAPQALFATTVSRENDAYRLNGTKFYTTGALFSDWIDVGSTNDDGVLVSAVVRRDVAGVEIDDDWNGFGQKLTASGTARFTNALVENGDVTLADDGFRYATGFFQLFHLAALAGIGRRLTNDIARAVRERRRNFSNANAVLARNDPQILQVVGKLRSSAYVSSIIVEKGAEALQRAYDVRFQDQPEREDAINAIAELEISQALSVISTLILDATTIAFDALGASATFKDLALDRFWRNARTLTSHNPRVFKERVIGDYAVNDTLPPYQWRIGVA